MAVCINKNSIEYQSLKDRAGISEFILEAVCRDFLEKYNRFPHLDELPNSNSEQSLRNTFKIKENNGVKISNLLEITGKETVEEATIDINNQYRDLEVKILPIVEEAIVDVVHRPTENNFDNLSEEDQILSKAPRDSEGYLLAPNGKRSNLTEKQYAQVRTKAFKRWFGDWESFTKVNPYNTNIILGKPEADYDSVDADGFGTIIPVNLNEKRIGNIALNNTFNGSGFNVNGQYVSMPEVGNPVEIEEEFRGKGYGKAMYFELAKQVANLGRILTSASDSSRTPASTRVWESLVRDGYAKRVGNRYEFINQTLSEASKVIDENGEPLVVYHSSPEYNITVFRNTDSIIFTQYSNETIEEAINRYKELGYEISSEQIDNIRKHNYDIFENPIILTKPNGIYAASNRKVSETYITRESYEEGLYLDGEVYPVFLNIRDNNIIEGNNSNWNEIQYKGKIVSTRKLESEFRDIKDGVIIKNIFDFGSPIMDTHGTNLSDIFIVYNPNQIKSATDNNGEFSKINNNIYDEVPNSYLILNNALQKLASLYGITFNEVTDAELNSDQWAGLIQDAQSVNAFVYNGQIYINTDRANIDAPIHEMFHILVGSMRFENPELYQNLINSVENLYNYSILASQYPGRSRNDINEEIFITELAKYFSGLPSELINLDQKAMYELTYNIKRTLDTILMGEDSVKTISDGRLYNMSLKEVIDEVNSTIATSNFHGFINIEGSELHRKLNNIKSDLLRNKTLEEICD